MIGNQMKPTITVLLILMLVGVTTKLMAQKEGKLIEVKQSIYIDVPREELWKITALEFGQVDKWISGVNKSTSAGMGINGSTCTERSCDPSYKGFKTTTETLTEFEPNEYRFAYQVREGMPKMVVSAVNEWTHEPSGNGTHMTMHVKMRVKGLMGSLMKGPMKKRMNKILVEALEELKLYAETGELHPRKIAAMEKYQEKTLAKQ